MKTIGVIFGGKSLEHDISILTGLQVVANLRQDYDVVPIFVDKFGCWWTGDKLIMIETFQDFNTKNAKKCWLCPSEKCLFVKSGLRTKQKKIDAIILALHGQNGEDGAIQGLLELCEIPYTSCGVFSSALTMDKAFCKMILMQNGIKTPTFQTFFDFEWKKNKDVVLENIKEKFNFNVVVKPSKAGSSIGVAKCQTKDEVIFAMETAFCFDNKVIVEELISDFKEVNVACVGNLQFLKISVFEEVKSSHEILDFDEKYLNSNATRIVDQKFDKQTTEKILQTAKKAFKVCECFGVVRMDFFVTENEVLLNEINSIPGSMANYLFKDMNFSKLCDLLIKLAEDRANDNKKLLKTYNSNALSAFKNLPNTKLFK